MTGKLDRRGFLRLSASVASGAVAAACAPATPVVIEKEVIREVPVEKEVIVEREVPKEVVKEVQVEKVVKQTVVQSRDNRIRPFRVPIELVSFCQKILSAEWIKDGTEFEDAD